MNKGNSSSALDLGGTLDDSLKSNPYITAISDDEYSLDLGRMVNNLIRSNLPPS
jgi:hypothetical protein